MKRCLSAESVETLERKMLPHVPVAVGLGRSAPSQPGSVAHGPCQARRWWTLSSLRRPPRRIASSLRRFPAQMAVWGVSIPDHLGHLRPGAKTPRFIAPAGALRGQITSSLSEKAPTGRPARRRPLHRPAATRHVGQAGGRPYSSGRACIFSR